jgi:hypothetical protein
VTELGPEISLKQHYVALPSWPGLLAFDSGKSPLVYPTENSCAMLDKIPACDRN